MQEHTLLFVLEFKVLAVMIEQPFVVSLLNRHFLCILLQSALIPKLETPHSS